MLESGKATRQGAGKSAKLKDPAICAIEPTHGPNRAGDIPHSLASIDKARRLLGYEPRYSMRDGLRLAVEWYWENL